MSRVDLNWHFKRKLYQAAYRILYEMGGAQSINPVQVQVQRSKSDGKAWDNWAIDFRSCIEEEAKTRLDRHYMMEGKEYRPLPPELKFYDRKLWRTAKQKQGLIETGERILGQI